MPDEELAGLCVRRGQDRLREDPAVRGHQITLRLGRPVRRRGCGGRFRRLLPPQTETARYQRVSALLR